jgi:hypothetical protein
VTARQRSSRVAADGGAAADKDGGAEAFAASNESFAASNGAPAFDDPTTTSFVSAVIVSPSPLDEQPFGGP